MKALIIVFALTLPAVCQQVVEIKPTQNKVARTNSVGAFGFEAGMTRVQLIARLGKNAVQRTIGDDSVVFNTAPYPHPAFKDYVVMFSPQAGAVQIIAFTPVIETNDSGEQLKTKFDQIADALQDKYGDGFRIDMLNNGSIWHEPNDWMMGLLKQDRNLTVTWPGPGWPSDRKLPNRLTGILLQAQANDRNHGIIALGYEFEGFSSYAKNKRKQQDASF